MKRVTLIVMMFAVFSISAQRSSMAPVLNSQNLSEQEIQSLNQDLEHKKAQRERQTFQKTSSMIGQRMSHSDVAASLFGNLLKPVYTPFAPDSTYVQVLEFFANVNVHGVGQTFDPTSKGFDLVGQPYLGPNDSYTIDTIYVGIRYRTAGMISGYTGDTLQVVAYMGGKNNNSVWRLGVGYNPNTYPNQPLREEVLVPRYEGNANVGVQGSIKAPSAMIFKYALSGADTALNYVKIVPPQPIQVPAGAKFGVFCTFVPGYVYDPATQYYYHYQQPADVNNISWLSYSPYSSTDKNAYFLERLHITAASEGISNLLLTTTRYGKWSGNDAFRNEYVSPTVERGNLIDFWVSGNSSVGLEEQTAMDYRLELFPNPGNGLINISVPEDGDFQLAITDLQGRTVASEKVSLKQVSVFKRDFSHLPSGAYIINLTASRGVYSGRMVIH